MEWIKQGFAGLESFFQGTYEPPTKDRLILESGSRRIELQKVFVRALDMSTPETILKPLVRLGIESWKETEIPVSEAIVEQKEILQHGEIVVPMKYEDRHHLFPIIKQISLEEAVDIIRTKTE